MPQTFFTPRHVIEAVKTAIPPATVRPDPVVTRVDWVAIAQSAVEQADG